MSTQVDLSELPRSHPLRRAVVARKNWSGAAARNLPMEDQVKFGDKWRVAKAKAETKGCTLDDIDAAMGLTGGNEGLLLCTLPLDFPQAD